MGGQEVIGRSGTDGVGSNGSVYGGAGGGARRNANFGNYNGGTGANGYVFLDWVVGGGNNGGFFQFFNN